MTSEDVRNVTFGKAMRGYSVADVDEFLSLVERELDKMDADYSAVLAERDAALEAKAAAEQKMYILAQKVEEYRGQEETLKTALINAQRMGETVVHEAKQKADAMVRDATGKTELLRQQAEQEIAHEKETLEKLQAEVARFKATVLSFYKQHIESMSALDEPSHRVAEVMKEMETVHKESKVAAQPAPAAPAAKAAPAPAPKEETAPAPPPPVVDTGTIYKPRPEMPAAKPAVPPANGKQGAGEAKGGVNLFGGVPVDRD